MKLGAILSGGPEADRISNIKESLEVNARIKEAEYQNALVLQSLEAYNDKYEKFRIEHEELQAELKLKIAELQQSNATLTDNLTDLFARLGKEIEKERELLRDSTHQTLEALLSTRLDSLNAFSVRYIAQVENQQKDAQKRFNDVCARRTWVDRLSLVNLMITPVILGLLVYWMFFKQ